MVVKPDETLVVRACAGDAAAAGELIRAVWPDAYRIAWSLLGDRSAAEDAAQEACARAWRKLKVLRSPERFAVWFYRIVVNESKRITEARRRDAPVLYESALNEVALDDRIAVRTAIAALEPRLRLPIVLRYYFGLRSSEIAHVLDASAVTIRWRVMLAHRRLASALDDRPSPPRSNAPSDGRYKDESIAAS
jgi:RNA polymerase sigma-70 factor, ECF subfamily